MLGLVRRDSVNLTAALPAERAQPRGSVGATGKWILQPFATHYGRIGPVGGRPVKPQP